MRVLHEFIIERIHDKKILLISIIKIINFLVQGFYVIADNYRS